MSARPFDVIVFGATGYTGQIVAEYLASRAYEDGAETRFALAGRSASKLEVLRSRLAPQLPETTGVVVADSLDPESLVEMTRQCRVLINCVGPFRMYGQQVVEACVQTSTDYVDVTGEPEFVETVMLKYGERAEEAGVLIVPCCGFDCVPSDMGVQLTMELVNRITDGQGRLSSIETFTSFEAKHGVAVNACTLDTAVLSVSSVSSLKQTRKALRAQQTNNGEISVQRCGPKPHLKRLPHWSKTFKAWCVPFMGADSSIVRNSQLLEAADRHRAGEEPRPFPHYSHYFALKSFWALVLLVISALVGLVFSRFERGRKLMYDYPHLFTFGVFTRQGPTEKQRRGTRATFDFFVNAFSSQAVADRQPKSPDLQLHTRVSMTSPFYTMTARFVAQAALLLVEERDTLSRPAGVLTAGAAFRGTSYGQRIQDVGLEFSRV